MPEESKAMEHATITNDEAINKYMDQTIGRIGKLMELLVAAEESHVLSRACNSKDGEGWRNIRDGLRGQGSSILHEAGKLFNKRTV